MAGNVSLPDRLESVSLSEQRHKIIIGIDYGTTFSGISYVTTDKRDIDDINIINTWPGEPTTTYKTPTRIAYKRENPKIQSNKWGFEVYPKLVSYSWTKLLLDRNAAAGEYDDPTLASMSGHGMMKLPVFRDAAGVCEDFLHELYDYVSMKLRQQMSSLTYDNTPMECWITLPAIWSEEAKDATLKAAKSAGFGSRPEDEVYTIAEPEAAAIAALKKYSGPGALNPVEPSEHVLICDCGGGTVDITTYTVTQVTPRLEFDELCVGIGGKCGSTYIDRNLHALLSKRFGEAFDNIPFAQKGPGSRFMACFEMVKRDFGRNDDREEVELSPLRLDIPDSEFYDDDERIVKLTHEDMQSLFDPVIAEITKLLSQQVREARTVTFRKAAIDRIILVGGFGESPYLNKALTKWCRENGNITLLCPEHPQSAVVRGAALRGLEGLVPRVKRARKHYGVGLNMLFREGQDPEEKAYVSDYDDEKYCRGRIWWLIAKGEEITKDTLRNNPIVQEYTPGREAICSLILYSSALSDPPEYCSDSRVDRVGSIVSKIALDFDYGPSSSLTYSRRLMKLVYQFSGTVQVIFGSKGENLTFKIVVNGKVLSTASIEFNQQ